MRHTTFSFTLEPTAEQAAVLRRHVGAARFAFNQALRLVQDALEAKTTAPETRVPWSGFDLINAFNAWKRSSDAGLDEAGRAGLAWRGEVCQQVFEEAVRDGGRWRVTLNVEASPFHAERRHAEAHRAWSASTAG